jgi:hypothetical protein
LAAFSELQAMDEPNYPYQERQVIAANPTYGKSHSNLVEFLLAYH